MAPRDKSGSKDDVQLCGVLRARAERGHATVACACHDAWLGGGCQCALDVASPEEALRDPWDVATSGGVDASGSGVDPGVAALVRKLQGAAREPRERCWRYVIFTLPRSRGKTNRRACCARAATDSAVSGQSRPRR